MRARRPAWAALILGVLLTAGVPAPAHAQSPARTQSPGTECRNPPIRVESARPWAQQLLGQERVWDLTRGEGVLVGVVDSGVDAAVPQLAGAVLNGTDVFSPGGGPANTDCLGHGTFVAGIIAGQPQDGIGFAGVAPGARILPVRDTASSDGGSVRTMASGIRAAVDGGAKVVNISESTYYDDPVLKEAVQYARSRDVLLVAAVANGAEKGNPTPYPAAYPGVLAVGAIDATGAAASFSQTGPFVGLVAPGVAVMSLGPGGPGHWQDDGTSFAAPFVSGTAALVRSYRPELTAEQVLHRLEATATRPGATVPDPALGWGTVNPHAAVTAVLPKEDGSTGGSNPAGRVSPPEIPVENPWPLRTVLFSVAGLVVVVTGGVLLAGLLPAGSRRRWRRGRIVQVVESSREGS